MNPIVATVTLAFLAFGLTTSAALAAGAGGITTPQATCEAKAMSKSGTPLAGAAKTSFMQKCVADTCAASAVGKDGQPLAGAAKTSFMKKCLADACAASAVGQDGQPLAGAAKASFMKKCQSGA